MTLLRTPLFGEHLRLGARLVDFGGWEMPVQYAGILAEHQAVRTGVGLFDVSHMGEFTLRGPGALAAVQGLVTNDASALAVGQAMYTPMCYPDGGTVDDLLVYRTGGEDYLLVVNAGNIPKDREWVSARAGRATFTDLSEQTARLALQGPRAQATLQPLCEAPLGELRPFRFVSGTRVSGLRCDVARTGYTGEDGFEIFCAAADATALWRELLGVGGVAPCGLGARDTLRLEAALPLYGHELSPEINPLEARLGGFVKLEKGEFIGRDSLAAVKAAGPRRRLCGLVLHDRAIARAGYPVLSTDGGAAGRVTSGSFSPTLERSIAIALVAAERAIPGAELVVAIRGRPVPAGVVRLPFYRRPPA